MFWTISKCLICFICSTLFTCTALAMSFFTKSFTGRERPARIERVYRCTQLSCRARQTELKWNPFGQRAPVAMPVKLGLNAKPMKACTSPGDGTKNQPPTAYTTHQDTPGQGRPPHPVLVGRDIGIWLMPESLSLSFVLSLTCTLLWNPRKLALDSLSAHSGTLSPGPPDTARRNPSSVCDSHTSWGACAATPTAMQSVAHQGVAAAVDAASVASQRSLAAWAVDATPMRPKDLSQHEWNVIILQMKNFNAMHWSLLQQGRGTGRQAVEEGVWEGVGEGGGIECGFVGNSCCQLSVAWHPALCWHFKKRRILFCGYFSFSIFYVISKWRPIQWEGEWTNLKLAHSCALNVQLQC